MGRQHVRVLQEMDDVELVGAADVSADARSRVEQHTGLVATSDWRSLLEGPADAVVNALPTPEHFEVTRQLLMAGKDVLVEKPIAVTTDEAEQLLSRRRALTVFCSSVTSSASIPPSKLSARSWSRGEIGDVVALGARRVGIARPVAPRTDVVIDLAIHDIDVCGYLLPAESGPLAFASARALWGNQQRITPTSSCASATAVAIVQANWITPVKIRRLTVTGTEGLADVDYLEQSLRIYRGAPEVFEGRCGTSSQLRTSPSPEDVPVERGEPLRGELPGSSSACGNATVGRGGPTGRPRVWRSPWRLAT